MNGDFPRLLTLLRKERGISQKSAAQQLGISQALLSHYEKGIRECGQDYIVRAADYYGVSCDYLLGRSPDRSGTVISVDEIPEADAAGKENVFRGSMIPTLSKKLIANSLNILFDILQRSADAELTREVSSFLTISVYKMFRHVYSINEKNPAGFFAVDEDTFEEVSTSAMVLSEMKVRRAAQGIGSTAPVPLELSPEKISHQYPLFATSLTNLVKNVETTLEKTDGSK